MKKMMVLYLAAMLFNGAASPASADDKSDLDRKVTALDAQAVKPDGQERVFTAISKESGVPVASLKQQKQSSGLGFGDLLIANALAKATGKTFDQIVTEFKSHEGWGKIAKENNVKLGKLISQVKRAEEATERDEKHKADRDDKNGKQPGDAGRDRGVNDRHGGGRK
ncbi:MAG: hypothetical protein HY300_00320 [Verrucomicrobia bacterium]|nr:hypothetical protein [Verrucomicrobiota bacterium]